jgi:endonuclease YncB( thermonuclease family)
MTMAGLLEVVGRIPIEQFWPDGESDADTTKIKVEVGEGSFRFREHPGAPFRVTHAFDRARVKGRITKEIIDKKGRVTIRLQGVDAPELHYMPQAIKKAQEQTKEQRKLFLEWNHRYRQHFAESATVALKTLLEGGGSNDLECRVVTAVDAPDDAIDTYGRLVGDIEAELENEDVNLNRWLTSKGWTVPAFYNSMSGSEIRTLLQLGEEAREKRRGFWLYLMKKVAAFDFDVRYRSGTENHQSDDAGAVLMPKLFRRQCVWAVNKRAKMVTGTFKAYLEKKLDVCYLIDEFLEQGPTAATPRQLSDFVGPSHSLLARPQDLVFHEEGARLIGPDGTTPAW